MRRLGRRGFSGRIGSWTSQDEPRSTVLHAPGRATDARRIASALGISEVRVGVPPDVVAPESARPDVVVVIGARP